MINVLLFAGLKETAGIEKLSIERANMTVAELKKHIEAEYQLDVGNAMVAINEEYADEQQTVHVGDVVAFIPPVSGG